MKTATVKQHTRKGRVVKKHTRSVKGEMSPGKSKGLTKEQCTKKYEMMLKKMGEDHPDVVAMREKIDGMTDTTMKESRTKKKHSRNMRKNIDEEILVKESKTKKKSKPKSKGVAKEMSETEKKMFHKFMTDSVKKKSHARTVKGKDGKFKAGGHHTEFMAGRGVGKNIHQKINDRVLEMDETSAGRKTNNIIRKQRGGNTGVLADFMGKAHTKNGKGNKAKRRTTKK